MKYVPIACALHDYLEIACTVKLNVAIEHDDGRIIEGIAINVFSQDQAEWMVLERNGEQHAPLRLDQIRSIRALQPNPHFEQLDLKA